MTGRIPFLDLRVIDPNERRALLAALERVLDHGRLVGGSEVTDFEGALAAYCGTRYAVGVGSGSAALFLAMRALGIGPGDEVILPAMSFVASAAGVALAGAKAVFVDVQPDLLIDPNRVAAAISSRTRAIMGVHFTGKPAPMTALCEIAKAHGLAAIEDAAPAVGAERDGRRVGGLGLVACHSMNPMKVLGALGDAGAITTDRADLYQRLLALRYHDIPDQELCASISMNGRLDPLQAAFLRVRLDRLEEIIERRRSLAAIYSEGLRDIVEVPSDPPDGRHVYYTYTILCEARDRLAAFLAEREIETKTYHRHLMPEHPAFGGTANDYPVGRSLAARLLCLPMHEKMQDSQVARVVDAVRAFYGTKR